MRRKDREVKDPETVKALMNRCHCFRLGFNDNGEVYIVPLNFGWEETASGFVFYFHSAKEGRKIDLIAHAPQVGFEMDADYQLKTADMACAHTASFGSIIGNGTVSMVDDENEKKHGLSLMMRHATGRADWDFSGKMLDAVAVFRLDVSSLSCKVHE